jgi:hypothetical protein
MNKKTTLIVGVSFFLGAMVIGGSPSAIKINYKGHGYEYVTKPKLWKDAKKDAEERNGYLVCITTADENEFVVQLINNATDKEVPRTWIGLNDDKVEGDWKWLSGELTSFTNWFHGEPNNSGSGENKVVYGKRDNEIKWNDVSGDGRYYYVIEYNFEIDTDTNAAGMSKTNLRSTR